MLQTRLFHGSYVDVHWPAFETFGFDACITVKSMIKTGYKQAWHLLKCGKAYSQQ